MPRPSITACLVLVALTALPATADEDAAPRLSAVLAGLGSPQPAARHASLTRLETLIGRDPSRDAQAVRPLADLLRRRPPDEAARAVALLARMRVPRSRQLWLRALDPEQPPPVFAAAVAGAAARKDDPEALRALLDRARDTRTSLAAQALALEALGMIGGSAGRLPLVRPGGAEKGVADTWLRAAGRALGLMHLGGRDAAKALLSLLEHPHEAVRVHAWEALVHLTRQTLPLDVAAWRAWFKANPDALCVAEVAPEPAPLKGADRYRLAEPAHVPRYYGIPIQRPHSRVVFCLDVSQSMYGRGIEQARGELTRTLSAFPSSYAFEVIAFNERLRAFAGELVPAHPVVKARAIQWLRALETISYTNLFDAVETAFGHAGVGNRSVEKPGRLDAVFLLSDGAPNRGRYRREDKVVEEIARLSRRRIPVHAVAAGEEVFPLLRRIADATGGNFVDAFEFE